MLSQVLNGDWRHHCCRRLSPWRCFEVALERLIEREACRLAVTLLTLAHEENCEAELAAKIDSVLDERRLPAPNDLKARCAPDPSQMPRIDVAKPYLAS